VFDPGRQGIVRREQLRDVFVSGLTKEESNQMKDLFLEWRGFHLIVDNKLLEYSQN
jgi:hypothetical protein